MKVQGTFRFASQQDIRATVFSPTVLTQGHTNPQRMYQKSAVCLGIKGGVGVRGCAGLSRLGPTLEPKRMLFFTPPASCVAATGVMRPPASKHHACLSQVRRFCEPISHEKATRQLRTTIHRLVSLRALDVSSIVEPLTRPLLIRDSVSWVRDYTNTNALELVRSSIRNDGSFLYIYYILSIYRACGAGKSMR
jgi:hypothetical protein